MDESRDSRWREPLESRIGRLERAHRRWRVIGAAGLAALGVVVLLGASSPSAGGAKDELRARRFAVVDKAGQVRGRLHLSEYGSLRLDLYDPKKVLRASLSLGKLGSPALNLFDEKGQMRASLGLLADGSSSLSLFDAKGLRAVLGRTKLESSRTGKVDERPVSSLVLFDEAGNVLWRAPP